MTDLPKWILARTEAGGALDRALRTMASRSFAISEAPTDDLARLMKKHGSDKYGWLHSYTVAYSSLFDPVRADVKNMLEVGIGTNYVDVPSTMGPNGVPGASLRAWRDYFPNASVHGADVDKRILFKETRIDTHYVDQLSADAIAAMWTEIGGDKFDVVIDDGLHTYEANRSCMENSIGHVKDGGFYIIEDVVCGRPVEGGLSGADNAKRFADMLEATGYQFALVAAPHYFNREDNMLCFVEKRAAPADTGYAQRKKAWLDGLESALRSTQRMQKFKRFFGK
ncbi:MAG TPA: hypothetical protein PKA55_16815 [Rhodoblastus sp.]|nr:hypothetical protein [Rhodoblastus sp.]